MTDPTDPGWQPIETAPIWTEGVCGDSAVILRDGAPVPISDVLAALNGTPTAPQPALPEPAPQLALPMGLTFSQRKTLNIIKDYIREKGYSPTYQEIVTLSGRRSKTAVYKMVHRLMERGYIRIAPGQNRSITIIGGCVDDSRPTLPKNTEITPTGELYNLDPYMRWDPKKPGLDIQLDGFFTPEELLAIAAHVMRYRERK